MVGLTPDNRPFQTVLISSSSSRAKIVSVTIVSTWSWSQRCPTGLSRSILTSMFARLSSFLVSTSLRPIGTGVYVSPMYSTGSSPLVKGQTSGSGGIAPRIAVYKAFEFAEERTGTPSRGVLSSSPRSVVSYMVLDVEGRSTSFPDAGGQDPLRLTMYAAGSGAPAAQVVRSGPPPVMKSRDWRKCPGVGDRKQLRAAAM